MNIRPFRWSKEAEITRPFVSPYGSLQKEMNKLMETFFSDSESPMVETAAFSPSMDIAEEEKGFWVHVELPGLSDKDVDLSFEKNVLRIKGEKKAETEEKQKNFHRIERSYGSFYRAIPFSTEIDESKIDAKFEKGVLNIWLPKAAAALREAKKIQIKTT